MRVLVLAAHPDDETLGCGGTLARHVQQGDEVLVLWFTKGASRSPEILSQANAALEVLGVKQSENWMKEDQTLDTLPLTDIISRIEITLSRFKPDVVYTHSSADLNQDHLAVHHATLIACRPASSSVKRILAYEVPSSTECGTRAFQPTVYVNISRQQLTTKIKAMACYVEESRPCPHPRSPTSLIARAMMRGTSVGIQTAEALELIREVR